MNKINEKVALVTGSEGFIGHYLNKLLYFKGGNLHMTIKIIDENKKSNVIEFKNQNNKSNKVKSSTIAAIIAVKIDHCENIEPQDYIIDKLEEDNSIEVLAYEDALESAVESSTLPKSTHNVINDA